MGPLRADLLKKELNIFHYEDLLTHFPFRHIDRTEINAIIDLNPQMEYAQLVGTIIHAETIGKPRAKRLVAEFRDSTGSMELTWFQGVNWVQKTLEPGLPVIVYGRLSFFNGKPQIIHPELEPVRSNDGGARPFLEPVYSTTEKLKAKGMGARQIGKLSFQLLANIQEKDIPENLPALLRKQFGLIGRFQAIRQIHFPQSMNEYEEAVKRLKFEELFIAQLRMGLLRSARHRHSKGVLFDKVGDLFNEFFHKHLPFELTSAQKRVIREIRIDTAKGKQMNRLLQGDVGSGKTIVAVLIMLLAADNGFQSCIMAPTEILATQHYKTISELLERMDLPVRLLTGSTKAAERRKILSDLKDGTLKIIIGTHALIEDPVQFQNLGMVVIDEQHRFGVEQRARLWKKAEIPPHILVMTATPIPRTLAMTAYGDLDYSVIDELPPGRKPISTVHRYETNRHKVMDFIRSELDKGNRLLHFHSLSSGSHNPAYHFPRSAEK